MWNCSGHPTEDPIGPLSICESTAAEYFSGILLTGILLFLIAVSPGDGPPETLNNEVPDGGGRTLVSGINSAPFRREHVEDEVPLADPIQVATAPYTPRRVVVSYILAQFLAAGMTVACFVFELVKAKICCDPPLFWVSATLATVYGFIFLRQRLSLRGRQIKDNVVCCPSKVWRTILLYLCCACWTKQRVQEPQQPPHTDVMDGFIVDL